MKLKHPSLLEIPSGRKRHAVLTRRERRAIYQVLRYFLHNDVPPPVGRMITEAQEGMEKIEPFKKEHKEK